MNLFDIHVPEFSSHCFRYKSIKWKEVDLSSSIQRIITLIQTGLDQKNLDLTLPKRLALHVLLYQDQEVQSDLAPEVLQGLDLEVLLSQ